MHTLGSCRVSVVYDLNSHVPLIALDRDARRLVKRQKLYHPRLGMLHEAEEPPVGPQSDIGSPHASGVGRWQFDQSLPLQRNWGDGDKLRGPATTSGKIGKSREKVGRSRLRPMVGVVAARSEVKFGEVRTELSSPFLSWTDVELRTGNVLDFETCTRR